MIRTPSGSSPAGRDVEICYVRTGSRCEASLARLLPQLTAEEQARAARFVFAKDGLAFAAGRALVRRVISQRAGVQPGSLRFLFNAYGKPELAPDSAAAPFRFNISHCEGIVAAGFALKREIGLDVENLGRDCPDAGLARSFFAPDEADFLDSLPEGQRRAAFFGLWTLKEAYIKARGMGLSIPLADFAFALDPLGVAFSPRLDDRAENWFFWRDFPTPSHAMALAVARRPDEDLIPRVHEIPLEALF